MKSITKKLFSLFTAAATTVAMFPAGKAFASYEISGADLICRAPFGRYAAHEYKLSGFNKDEVIWSISDWQGSDGAACEAPGGVIMTKSGGLIVPGNAENAGGGDVIGNNDAFEDGSFLVTASSTNGDVLAEKRVTYAHELSNWTDFPTRVYDDMQALPLGGITSATGRGGLGSTNWQDYPLQYNQGPDSKYNATVEQEDDGNVYIRSAGVHNQWSNCSGLLITPYTQRAKMQNQPVITMESRFRAESEVLENNRFSLWYVCVTSPGNTDDKGGLDIRYKKLENGNIGIYSHMNGGEGRYNDYSDGRKVAEVEADKWFDARAEIDTESHVFSLYINDELVMENEPTVLTAVNWVRIGASVDDFALYSGKKVMPRGAQLPDRVYLTSGRNKAAVKLDNRLMLGEFAVDGAKVDYSVSGAEYKNGYIYISDGGAEVRAKNSEYGLDSTSVIETEGGTEILGETDASGAPFSQSLNRMKGRIFITFEYKGKPYVEIETDGGAAAAAAEKNSEEGKAAIILDTQKGEFKAIFGGSLAAEKSGSFGSLGNIRIENALFCNLIISSAAETNPYVFNPQISGIYAAGQELSAESVYYSPWLAEKESDEIIWFYSDEPEGEYKKAGSGAKFVPDESLAEKYVKFEISARDCFGNISEKVCSNPVKIMSVYSAELSGSELNVTVNDVLDQKPLYGIAMLYKNGIFKESRIRDISFSGGAYLWTENIGDADGAIVSLIYKDSFKPVGEYKAAGNVPEIKASDAASNAKLEYKNGRLYVYAGENTPVSVLIYGHKGSFEDLISAYSDVYERDEAFASGRGIVFAACVLTGEDKRAVINLPGLERGSYFAETVSRNGEKDMCLFMAAPELLMTAENMSESGFKNVIKKFLNKNDQETEAVFDLCSRVNNKNYIVNLLKFSDYDINRLEVSAMLVKYLEGDTQNDSLYNSLENEMKKSSLRTDGISLMRSDANPSETGGVILNSSYNGFSSLANVIYEKSVLYGVYHVKSYMEADAFLKGLNYAGYNNSAYKNDICLLVHKKLYKSIDELKAAIDGYIPPSDNPGGGGAGGGGGGGGSRGGGSSVPGVTAEQKPVSEKPSAAFSDLKDDHWASSAVNYLFERGIINGNPDGTFGAERNITRAEFVKMLCVALELSGDKKAGFSDVAESDWFSKYVYSAAALEIVMGTDDGRFLPQTEISREDAAVLICRGLKYKGRELSEASGGFADGEDISDYAKESVNALYASGIVKGDDDGYFLPKNKITRAECAQMFANALRGYDL